MSRLQAGEKAEGELRLTKHSYRAGLWDAKTFTNHYWAETWKKPNGSSASTLWIWAMVFVCFSRRIEILTCFLQIAADWVRTKLNLARFFLPPHLASLSPEVKQAVAYQTTHRKAGFPISSGTVESAAKTLIQQRMKQAHALPAIQAMLALRARLLSQRWHEIPI